MRAPGVRVFVLAGVLGASCVVLAQSSAPPAYLRWSAAEAQRIGQSLRVDGRVGGLLDLRLIHTERSFNYKLRATWLTREVIEATARLAQLRDRLTDDQAAALVRDATAVGDAVFLVEIDPREGSGIIPPDWKAFLGPAGNDAAAIAGTDSPSIGRLQALQGVYRRDYNYDRFWVVFPLKRADGTPLLPAGTAQVALTVRSHDKEGRVKWPRPAGLPQ